MEITVMQESTAKKGLSKKLTRIVSVQSKCVFFWANTQLCDPPELLNWGDRKMLESGVDKSICAIEILGYPFLAFVNLTNPVNWLRIQHTMGRLCTCLPDRTPVV